MQVKVIYLAGFGYASIREGSRISEVRLDEGCSAVDSLRETVQGMRAKAEKTLERAEFIERAISLMDAEWAK